MFEKLKGESNMGIQVNVVAPSGALAEEVADIVREAIGKSLEKELLIGKALEARFGEQFIKLERALAERDIDREEILMLHLQVKSLQTELVTAKSNERLSRLRSLEELVNEGYNSRNEYYRNKVVPTEMVFALLENLVHTTTRDNVYGSLKVLFANARICKKKSGK
jgi:hypothetical protein